MRVLGFLGRKFAGKNTCANVLRMHFEKNGLTVEEFAFADIIKSSLATMFNIADPTIFTDTMKKENTLILEHYTPRALMQWFGDLMKETFGNDFFVRMTMDAVRKSDADIVLITDVRYMIEANAIQEVGGTIVYVDRDAFLGPISPDAHSSETCVHATFEEVKSSGKFDYVHVYNVHSLKYLESHLPYVLRI